MERNDEYMRLRPGVGIIPPELRNRGYDKLGFAPGEGGIGALLASRDAAAVQRGASAAELGEVMAAALDAGADPRKLADGLRASGRTQKAA